jgi:hypothetical protein
MPEKSVGLFRPLEADLLHSQMPEKYSRPWNATCYIPHARKFWSLAPGQVSFQEPEDFLSFLTCGNVKNDIWVGGKMSCYQQRDCQSLVKEFSDGKLKQKGFFTV